MRVLFVSWHFYMDASNGASISARELLRALCCRPQWDVQTFCGPAVDNSGSSTALDILASRGIATRACVRDDGFASFSIDAFRDVGGIARNDFFSTLEELSSNKKLQGMYIVGDGTQWSIGAKTDNGHVSGPLWRIDYVGPDTMGNHSRVSLISALTYHMGSLVIHASQSDNSHSKSLVTSESQGGIFCGYTGEYNRLTSDHDPICKNWGCKFDEISWVLNGGFHLGCEYPYFIGGKQRTSTITRTYDNPLKGVSLDPDSESDD